MSNNVFTFLTTNSVLPWWLGG